MSDIIKNELTKFKNEFPNLRDRYSDEYLFSLLSIKLFINNGSFSNADFENSFCDGKDDGGIDAISKLESGDDEKMILIQSKYVNNISTQDIIDVFTKIGQTIKAFSSDLTANYNDRLKRVYHENHDSFENTPPNMCLWLVTKCSISEDMKNKVSEKFIQIEDLTGFDFEIIDQTAIEQRVKELNEERLNVASDKIEIDRGQVLKFGDDGLIVNIKALSLRKLYDKYKDRGLFEQNLRNFVGSKKIDTNIKNSLKEKRDKFWYLNNGIIIACKDYQYDTENIKLKNFSIVNGCQTTTLIGKYKGNNEDEEFLIPCKIIKSSDDKFLTDIAEASNSQKPISDRDLKSNDIFQRNLSATFIDNEVYIEIKRGVNLLSISQKRNLRYKWQYMKNDYYAQVILSGIYQEPGTARSGKKKIFSNNETYKKLFISRKITKNYIDVSKDMFKLYHDYTEYLDDKIKNGNYDDVNELNIATNGKLHIPAIVVFLIKAYREKLDYTKIAYDDEWQREVSQDSIKTPFFKNSLPDNYMDIISSLFDEIIYEVKEKYVNREPEEKTVSNFFKKDDTYRKHILSQIYNKFIKPKVKWDGHKATYFKKLFVK